MAWKVWPCWLVSESMVSTRRTARVVPEGIVTFCGGGGGGGVVDRRRWRGAGVIAATGARVRVDGRRRGQVALPRLATARLGRTAPARVSLPRRAVARLRGFDWRRSGHLQIIDDLFNPGLGRGIAGGRFALTRRCPRCRSGSRFHLLLSRPSCLPCRPESAASLFWMSLVSWASFGALVQPTPSVRIASSINRGDVKGKFCLHRIAPDCARTDY